MTADRRPLELDATGQAALVRDGDIRADELVELAIGAIEALDGDLNAVIHRRFDAARRELPGSEPDAPFRGVPILVKDLGSGRIAGAPFHRGNRALRDAGWTDSSDSHLVTALRAAGFCLLGKTNVPELGLQATTQPVAYGPTHNPWDLDRTPGGSSGGSAAAVAAGLVAVAHGSDGGGSIRIPASACGLVGLKVTRGRISAGPQTGESGGGRSVDGFVTRSVRDTAALLDLVGVHMPGDPVTPPRHVSSYLASIGGDVDPLRIGVLTTRPADGEPVDEGCAAAALAVARMLEALGHRIEVDHPAALAEGGIILSIMATHHPHTAAALAGIGQALGRELGPDDVEPATWMIAEIGRQQSGVAYVQGRAELEAYGRRIAQWFASGFDLLLTPTLAEPPPPLAELEAVPGEPMGSLLRAAQMAPFTATWNNVGLPAISLPLGTSPAGLPIGVQLVADFAREDLLLAVAAQLEQAMPWDGRRPPVHAATGR